MNSPGSIFQIFQIVLRSADHAPVVGIWMEKREIEQCAVVAAGSVMCVPAWSHRHHVHHLTQLSPGQTVVVVWSNVRTIVLEINILRSVCVLHVTVLQISTDTGTIIQGVTYTDTTEMLSAAASQLIR